jgi:hypothetical protein
MGKGLYDKYLIEKADGTQIDPNARYFILRYDKDPAAWFALKSYAGHTHNPELRRDLFAELRKYWGDHLKESHFASLDNLYRLEDDNRPLLDVARLSNELAKSKILSTMLGALYLTLQRNNPEKVNDAAAKIKALATALSAPPAKVYSCGNCVNGTGLDPDCEGEVCGRWKPAKCKDGEMVEIEITQRIKVDACVANEIKRLNSLGVRTEGSCCGHGQQKPSAIIRPSGVKTAEELGYVPVYREDTGNFEMGLRSECRCATAPAGADDGVDASDAR